jgi:spermidine/putrescine transport system permease protein
MLAVLRYLLLSAVLIFTISPLASIFLVSISRGRLQDIASASFDLHWYKEALSNPIIVQSFFTSAFIAAAAAVLSVFLAFGSVRLVRRLPPAAALAFSVGIGIPAILPAFISGFSFHIYYQSIGLDGTVLGIVSTHVLYVSPIAFFLLYLSHRNLNPQLEDCARNLGASEHQVALQVVLPQLAKACIGAAIICALISWDEFIITWFVSGFHKTLPTLVYGMLGNTIDPALFAVGTLIILVSLAFVVAFALLMKDQIVSSLERR